MKKLKLICLLMTIIVVGCDEGIEKKEPLSEIVFRNSEFEISAESRNLGLRSVSISNLGNSQFAVKGSGVPTNINGSSMDLFNGSFTLDLNPINDYVKIEHKKDILIVGLDLLIFNGLQYGEGEIEELRFNEGFLSLLTMFIEVTNNELERNIELGHTKPQPESETCLFNASSIRWSRTNAEFKAKEFAEEFLEEHPDCKKVSEEEKVDVTCAFGDTLCLAGVAIVCDGETCEN